MSKHLADERLMGVVEGTATPAEREHAAGCADCAGRAKAAAEGLALAGEAEMPDPAPLYWEAFRRQVSRRLEDEKRTLWVWRLGPALATAVLLLATLPSFEGPKPRPIALAPWSALPEEDPGLTVLAGVASTGAELAPEAGLAEDLAQLSDEDSQALAQALRAEIGQDLS